MARPFKKESGVFEKVPGSGIWYIRYRVEGKLVRKRVGSRQAARDELTIIKGDRASGKAIPTSAKAFRPALQTDDQTGGLTVGQLCDDYLTLVKAPDNPLGLRDLVNPQHRLRAIRKVFGDRNADSILGWEVEDWLRSMNRKAGTLNRYKSSFSTLYIEPLKRGRVRSNPIRSVPHFTIKDQPTRWLRPEEETRLRAVLQSWIDDCPSHHRIKGLYLSCHPIELTVALGTGLRKGSQYKMRWEHVDFDNRMFNLPASIAKAGKEMHIPMIDDVYAALRELQTIQASIQAIRDENAAGENHSTSRMVADGRVFNISENREWWNAALKNAAITGFRWHDLRHSFASRLVQAGVHLLLVKEACCHSSVKMTERYAHVNQTALHGAMSVLNRKIA